MNEAVPGTHPDQDVLADLAAEALPVAQAREVEAHVMSCSACEHLLADAERVRALLAVPDPGPMPADIWARMDAALAAERNQQPQHPHQSWQPGRPGLSRREQRAGAHGWFDGPADATAGPPAAGLPAAGLPTAGLPTGPPAADGHPPVARVPVPQPPPSMSFDEAPTAAWKAFLSEPPDPEPVPAVPVPQRVGRAVRSMRSRRDVRTEDRAVAWWKKPGVLTGAAAAGVVVVGLSVVGIMNLVGDDRTSAVTEALPGGGNRSILHSSGVEYTASTLVAQAKSLAKTGAPLPATGSVKPSGTTSSGKPSAASGKASPSTAAALGSVPAKPGTVADPAQLTKCLTALGDGDRQPVAVDLATYQGREAAVIVLPGTTGGYDVWVVARTCGPGQEGTLAFKTIPA